MTIYQVDAFTNKPFSGNPAGVCITKNPLDERTMQSIAAEMNLAETAFLVKGAEGYSLRWFTPKAEVDLCGHATLASAHILYQKGFLASAERAVFHTKSGVLYAKKQGDLITLDFPSEPAEKIDVPQDLERALGEKILYCGQNRMDILVELENEEAVKSLKPDIALLSSISDVRGVIVTARAKEYDFVSRFFAPAVGIDEDPVTGSAHCCLAPYWSKKTGKTSFKAYQASERGGELFCELSGERVYISGNAVTVMTCELEDSVLCL